MEHLLKYYSKIPNIKGKNFLGNKLIGFWQPRDCKEQAMQYDFKLLLDLNDRIQRQMYIKRVYEESTVKNLIPFFKKSSVFFDVGANIGYFSLLAQAVNKKLKVYSFEPLPKNRESLKLNIKINSTKSIELIETCVSDSNGDIQFSIPPKDECGWGRISNENIFNGETLQLKTQTLDSFCELNKISKVDFIKIDVEGFEYHVLKGAQKTLNAGPDICIELNDQCLKGTGVDILEIFSYLKNKNYNLFYIDKNNNLKITSAPLKNYKCWNYFALKNR